MKRKFVFLTILFLMLLTFYKLPINKVYCEISISAKSAILIEEKTGTVLFAKNCDDIRPMASTTKIMTALTVLSIEKDLNRVVSVPGSATVVEGSSMGLKENEKISVLELLYGLMLNSGNDAANTLAAVYGGQEFIDKMNEIARSELKVKSTSFTNPSGLPDDNHYTTARELALITRYAFKYDVFAEIVACESKKVSYLETPNARYLKNHNKLLKIYDGCDGVKTGFTKEAGRCLVSSATKNGVKLIAVTLNASDDWNDHKKMLDYGFERVSCERVLEAGEKEFEVSIVGGVKSKVRVYNKDEGFAVFIDKKGNYKTRVLLPDFLYAPVKEGDKAGVLQIVQNDSVVCEMPLVCGEDIDLYIPPKRTVRDYFKLLFEFLY